MPSAQSVPLAAVVCESRRERVGRELGLPAADGRLDQLDQPQLRHHERGG